MSCGPVFRQDLLLYIFCAYPDAWRQEVDIYRAKKKNKK